MLKEKIINKIIETEGGYVNDPSDSGGETNYGITIAVAKRFGYTGNMKAMTRDTAYEIYSKMYWDSMMLDHVVDVSERIAEELIDTAVNMGVLRSSEFFQRCLNILNNCEHHYKDIKVDGEIGPLTISAFNSFMKIRGKQGELVLFKMLNSLQGAFYIELAERRSKDEKFVFGWFLHRVS